MNIKSAKKKLREARFFLNHMIEQERKAGDEEPFDFYLSAFLNAGMSVRDAFHVEQDRNRNNAIKAWKKVWEVRLTPEEKRLYDFMREDRKHEVHRSGSSRKAGTENREPGPGTFTTCARVTDPQHSNVAITARTKTRRCTSAPPNRPSRNTLDRFPFC
jgi:hypothetical protein